MSSPRFSVSLREIEEYWTALDVLTANEVLDAYDEAELDALPSPQKGGA